MKVIIADDHSIVRKGLKQILLEEYPFAEVAEASNAEELINLTMSDGWDVVITDLVYARQKRTRCPSTDPGSLSKITGTRT